MVDVHKAHRVFRTLSVRWLLPAALTVLLLGVAGCGGTKPAASNPATPKITALIQSAYAAGTNYVKACSYLTNAYRQELASKAGGSCPKALSLGLQPATLKSINKITINGDRAVVNVTTNEDGTNSTANVDVFFENGQWKISSAGLNGFPPSGQ